MPADPQLREVAGRFWAALSAVTRCVTAERLFVSPNGYETNTLYAMTFRNGDPVRLRSRHGGWSDLMLGVLHQYEIVRDTDATRGIVARVTTRSYEYYLHDSQGAELLAFHWAPGPEFRGPDHPHIHVTAPLTVQTDRLGNSRIQRLDRIHVPTGRISLESVVRLLVDELEAMPRFGDWRKRLVETEEVFRSTQTRS